jgi:hypothetical protein
MLKVRASSLGLLMTPAKSIDPALLVGEFAKLHKSRPSTNEGKAAKEAELAPLWDRTLSAGAKTFVEGLAKQFIYRYEPNISSKATDKGNIVEGQSIELYNSCFFTSHKKNAERRTIGHMTGEPDIVDRFGRKIIDIKSPWSLDTFPAIRSSGECPLYEWQGRAYMMLWPDEVDSFELAYCMVSTPEELIGHEDESLHIVDRIDPMLRVTRLTFERDATKEALINTKLKEAARYFELVIEQITEEHA